MNDVEDDNNGTGSAGSGEIITEPSSAGGGIGAAAAAAAHKKDAIKKARLRKSRTESFDLDIRRAGKSGLKTSTKDAVRHISVKDIFQKKHAAPPPRLVRPESELILHHDPVDDTGAVKLSDRVFTKRFATELRILELFLHNISSEEGKLTWADVFESKSAEALHSGHGHKQRERDSALSVDVAVEAAEQAIRMQMHSHDDAAEQMRVRIDHLTAELAMSMASSGGKAHNKMLNANMRFSGAYPPANLKVTGLRGAAASANGLFQSSVHAVCHSKPVYENDTGAKCFFHAEDHHVSADGTVHLRTGMWIIGPSLDHEQCFAWASFRQKNTAPSPANSDGSGSMLAWEQTWEPSVYPIDAVISAVHATQSTPAKKKLMSRKRDLPSMIELTWNIFDSESDGWVDAHDWLTVAGVSNGEDGLLNKLQSQLELENDICQYIEEHYGDSTDTADHICTIVERVAQDGAVTKEQFFIAQDRFYSMEMAILRSMLQEQLNGETTAAFYGDLFPSSRKDLLKQHAEEEVAEQLDLFLDRHQDSLQKENAEKQKQVHHLSLQLNSPLLSKCFYQWRQRTLAGTNIQRALTMTSLVEPRLPWNGEKSTAFLLCFHCRQSSLVTMPYTVRLSQFATRTAGSAHTGRECKLCCSYTWRFLSYSTFASTCNRTPIRSYTYLMLQLTGILRATLC